MVTKVGRKYFTCSSEEELDGYKSTRHYKFLLSTWDYQTDSSRPGSGGVKLYLHEHEYIEQELRRRWLDYFRDLFGAGSSNFVRMREIRDGLTLEQLENAGRVLCLEHDHMIWDLERLEKRRNADSN